MHNNKHENQPLRTKHERSGDPGTYLVAVLLEPIQSREVLDPNAVQERCNCLVDLNGRAFQNHRGVVSGLPDRLG